MNIKKSVKVRKIIFEILFEIYQKSLNFDEIYKKFDGDAPVNEEDKKMIFNIVLNSMRNFYFVKPILKKYLTKRTSIKIKILLVSAITQILFLNFKQYAVTNDTVELAKIKKLNPGLINAVLKNIIKNINTNRKTKFVLENLPKWFVEEIKKSNLSVKEIIESSRKEPSLHLVFKSNELLLNFTEKITKTTKNSGFIKERKNIIDISNWRKGDWWVQDFSSMLPIYLSPEIKSKKTIDMCSAPGGKAFQTLCLTNDVCLIDKNHRRAKILEENLKRLNFNYKVKKIDALNIAEQNLYDIVILDSPCSGIGTLRRNPEILFKKQPPSLEKLTNIQTSLLSKASKITKRGGIIIYMVCSFFFRETKDIKNNFLEKNRNFSSVHFKKNKEKHLFNYIDKDGDVYCIPSELKGYMVDGFYATKFIRNG